MHQAQVLGFSPYEYFRSRLQNASNTFVDRAQSLFRMSIGFPSLVEDWSREDRVVQQWHEKRHVYLYLNQSLWSLYQGERGQGSGVLFLQGVTHSLPTNRTGFGRHLSNAAHMSVEQLDTLERHDDHYHYGGETFQSFRFIVDNGIDSVFDAMWEVVSFYERPGCRGGGSLLVWDPFFCFRLEISFHGPWGAYHVRHITIASCTFDPDSATLCNNRIPRSSPFTNVISCFLPQMSFKFDGNFKTQVDESEKVLFCRDQDSWSCVNDEMPLLIVRQPTPRYLRKCPGSNHPHGCNCGHHLGSWPCPVPACISTHL